MKLLQFLRPCIGGLLLISAGISAVSAKSARPNLLIIQTDEHNFRTLGCYRDLLPADQAFIWGEGVVVETPHIDWLARNGLIADRAYATSPVCTPSRASFMTGRYPQNTGAIGNDRPMLDEMVTFAEVLRLAGYATGYAGKWHLDGPGKPQWKPTRQFGWEDNRYMFNRGHWKNLAEDEHGPRVGATDKKGEPSYSLAEADDQSFTTDFLTDRAIGFIEQNQDRPFCYYLSIPDPHGPNTVRPPYDTMFTHLNFTEPASSQSTGSDLPDYAQTRPYRFKPGQMAQYFGMVKCIDDNIGRILTTLRETGILEHTYIVFTSDHGDLCGEHGRDNKGVPMEGSTRIPFILHAPGVVAPQTVFPHPIGTVDFKPTILALMGVEDTTENEGRDYSALLRSPAKIPSHGEDITFVRIGVGPTSTTDESGDGEDRGGNGWFGAFSRQFKLIVASGAPPSLFDLSGDPHELTNLIRSPGHRTTVRKLGHALLTYAQANHDPLLDSSQVQSDLAWAISDQAEYPR
jgi:arylsulfatase A-like enzyme